MKLSEMTDDELGAMVRDRFQRLSEAHDAGLTDVHPRDQWNSENRVLAAHRATLDGSGSGLGSRNLEPTDQPEAQDDPPPTSGTPRPPARNGGSLAADAALAALKRAVPGYGRLR